MGQKTCCLWKPAWLALGILGILLLVSAALVLVAGSSSGQAKVGLALDWTRTLAGILVTIGGVGGAGLATLRARRYDTIVVAGLAPGVVGVLAGATLLGVGHWAIAAALGVAGLGAGIGYGLRH
jgi:hypothetical protein